MNIIPSFQRHCNLTMKHKITNISEVCVAIIIKPKGLWDAVGNTHHETKKFNFDAASEATSPVEK